MNRMTIEFEGGIDDPFEPGKMWTNQWATLTAEEREHRHQVIVRGTYVMPDGELMPEANVRRVRATLLGTYDSRPRMLDPREDEPGRELISGLWRWGTVPMLGGPPKVGKSTLIAELIAALIIPGRRFLGYFDPVQLTPEERARAIWLLNAENPPGELHEALLAAGLQFDIDAAPYYYAEGGGVLYVEHLEDHGGASVFDLTVPENRDWWEYRFMQCPCTGIDDSQPPLVVIADGVTAMLGSDTTRYGAWFGPFRDLLRALDVPNGLAVGHNGLAGKHLMNGVESMAGPDGLWTYTSPNADEPSAPRYFWTVPRLRAAAVPKGRVRIGEDGLLSYKPKESPSTGLEEKEPESTDWEQDVLTRLIAAGESGLMTTEVTGRGRVGQLRKKALDALAKAGRIVSRAEGQGTRWHLSDPA